MCGRFTLAKPAEEVAAAFGLDDVPELAPRYNIAPTQPVPTIHALPGGGRRLLTLRWGVALPGPGRRRPVINARAETAAAAAPFRDAFRRRRCLVAADGFYEWKDVDGRRQPFHLRMADGRPFALAGLWEGGAGAEPGTGGSCLVLTTRPNALVAEIHDRMPLILPPEAYPPWLDPALEDPLRLRPLLRPFPERGMIAVPVGLAVNNARVEGPVCLEPPR